MTTFKDSEDKLFQSWANDTWSENGGHPPSNEQFKSFLHESHKRMAEKIVKEIMQKTLDSWHEVQTLRMNIDGSTTPDVNLEKMGKILLEKVHSIIKSSLQ